MVIIISGKQGSGKTTLSTALKKQLEADGRSVATIKFADPLYHFHNQILASLAEYGIKREIKKDGPLLQLLGTDWARKTIDENIWVKIAQNRIQTLPEGTVAIIDDCRFENEFDAFPDAVTVRLLCQEAVRKERCEMWRPTTDHPSETGLDVYAEDGAFDLYFETETQPTDHIVTAIIFHYNKQAGI